MFKISTFDGWLVVVNGTQQIDDIRRSNDEQMHGMTTVAEVCHNARSIPERPVIYYV